MQISEKNIEIDFNEIPVDNFWNNNVQRELKMHKIHAYPAKFPSFMIPKSLEYAEETGVKVKSIADIFCGCGTTALEAKRSEIDFWGCDINPVATLIAKTKSEQYSKTILESQFKQIIDNYSSKKIDAPDYYLLNERINYWFYKEQINDLYKLLSSIRDTVPKGKYQNFFLCAFSNILKGVSKWLTKSIKPQVDPNKIPQDVKTAIEKQFNFMLNANQEAIGDYSSKSKTKIRNTNFLNTKLDNISVDMLITSPPYVTSYEYADIHQLSTLWLEYVADYRNLREGTIGSLYHHNSSNEELNSLNHIGKDIFNKMLEVDKRKAKSIAKYFLDIKNTISKSSQIINPGGLAVFVIGNTKYKNVEVDNAKYLTKCMLDEGFSEINVFKRKISYKNLTPYRDSKGKFSTNPNHRKVYNHEFVIIANKTT